MIEPNSTLSSMIEVSEYEVLKALQKLRFNVFCLQRLHLKFYEEKCIALLKEYPEAVNSPKLPLMYTPFLVREEVINLSLFDVKFTMKWSSFQI